VATTAGMTPTLIRVLRRRHRNRQNASDDGQASAT
jgi:hypothetical protein